MENELIKVALDGDFARAAIVDTDDIVFHQDYRDACEKNVCRKYDTNWMGPPAIGPIEELMKRVKKYKRGLLVQTVYQASGPFDIEGMAESSKMHDENLKRLAKKLREDFKLGDILPLSVGCCNNCERCAYLDDEPCRFPDEAMSSVEAYGIDVTALEKGAGIPYFNGKDTFSYAGLILFN